MNWSGAFILGTSFVIAAGAQAQTPAVSAKTSVAPAAVSVSEGAATGGLVPNQIVYAQKLPSAGELSNAAAAQGMTIERIEQTISQVIAVFKTANGQTNIVSYQLVPPAVTVTGSQVVVPAPAAEVVYRPAPRAIYYDDYDSYYYPRYWRPSISIGLGYGFRRGGYYGGHGWGGHGHGRR